MLAAFPYTCPCGHWFVIGVDDEARLGGWMSVVHDVAMRLGAPFVDATEPTFSCPGCGASHARASSRSTSLAQGRRFFRPEMS